MMCFFCLIYPKNFFFFFCSCVCNNQYTRNVGGRRVTERHPSLVIFRRTDEMKDEEEEGMRLRGKDYIYV